MSLYHPPQVSEREAGGWEDCTWASGVMLNNAAHGRTVSPSTRAEYEALRVAGGDGPAEKPGDGSNNDQLRAGIRARYHWAPAIVGHLSWGQIVARLARPGDCAAITGSMAVWPIDSHWRRWDPQFHAGHEVFVERMDNLPRIWWMNPQAPNEFAGEFIPLAELRRFYMGFTAGALLGRVGHL